MPSLSPYQLEPYADSPQAREELVEWLVATEGSQVTLDWWQARLRHWWDDNPWSALVTERGWLLRTRGKIVGFQGLIPAAYAVDGQQCAACISSTWRVDLEHRNQSVAMLMQLRRMGAGRLLVDSTPTQEVQTLLKKTGWTAEKDVTQLIVVPRLLGGHRLEKGKRVVTSLDEVRALKAPFASAQGVEKWITPEYLRWYARSVTRQHIFAGVVDAAGCLSSYVFLTPSGFGSWMEVDHFSCGSDAELGALVAALRGRFWVKLHAFPGDNSWQGIKAISQRSIHVCHHFLMPGAMRSLPKRTVLAEGDWGL